MTIEKITKEICFVSDDEELIKEVEDFLRWVDSFLFWVENGTQNVLDVKRLLERKEIIDKCIYWIINHERKKMKRERGYNN